MSTVRVQLDFPSDKVKALEDLMKEVGISTKKDLFNNALTLLDWVVQETKNNRIIASVDEEKNTYKQLVMPMLSGLKKS